MSPLSGGDKAVPISISFGKGTGTASLPHITYTHTFVQFFSLSSHFITHVRTYIHTYVVTYIHTY